MNSWTYNEENKSSSVKSKTKKKVHSNSQYFRDKTAESIPEITCTLIITPENPQKDL